MTTDKRDLAKDLAICDRFKNAGVGRDSLKFSFDAEDGWPHAIRRAIAVEAWQRRAVEVLKRVDEHLEDMGYLDGEGGLRCDMAALLKEAQDNG